MVYEFLHIEIPLPQVDTQFQQTSQNLLTCPWNVMDNVMQYLVGLTYDNLLQKTHSMVVWLHVLLGFLMLRSSMEKKNPQKNLIKLLSLEPTTFEMKLQSTHI